MIPAPIVPTGQPAAAVVNQAGQQPATAVTNEAGHKVSFKDALSSLPQSRGSETEAIKRTGDGKTKKSGRARHCESTPQGDVHVPAPQAEALVAAISVPAEAPLFARLPSQTAGCFANPAETAAGKPTLFGQNPDPDDLSFTPDHTWEPATVVNVPADPIEALGATPNASKSTDAETDLVPAEPLQPRADEKQSHNSVNQQLLKHPERVPLIGAENATAAPALAQFQEIARAWATAEIKGRTMPEAISDADSAAAASSSTKSLEQAMRSLLSRADAARQDVAVPASEYTLKNPSMATSHRDAKSPTPAIPGKKTQLKASGETDRDAPGGVVTSSAAQPKAVERMAFTTVAGPETMHGKPLAMASHLSTLIVGNVVTERGADTPAVSVAFAKRADTGPAKDPSTALEDAAPPTGSLSPGKLMERLGESELQMRLRSPEFGSVSIRTSVVHEQLTTRIALDHGEVGKVLSAEVPTLQAKLTDQHGLNSHIEVHTTGSFSGSSGQRYYEQTPQAQRSEPPVASNEESSDVSPSMLIFETTSGDSHLDVQA